MKNKKLAIYINDICNRNCSFCYVNKTNKIMTLETANKIISYINDNDIYKTIIFVGGEPTLTPDLIKYFIDNIKINVKYGVMTNGIIKNLDIFKPYKNLTFNISFINEKDPDNYYKEMTIKKLNDLNIKYNALIVNTPNNIVNLLNIFKYIIKLKPTYIKLLRQHKMGDIWTLNDIYKYKEILPKLIHFSIYCKEKFKTYNQISLPNKIDIPIQYSSEVYDKFEINLVDQDSICKYDIVGVDGKQYLCDGACGENKYCFGYIWDKPNNPYLIHNFGYEDVLYDYCYLANNKVCLDFDKINDKYRDYYNNIISKIEGLK